LISCTRDGNSAVKKLFYYFATAAAIAIAVWAIVGAPLPSHPLTRVVQEVGER